jgi:hypothetical protein
MLSKRRDNMKKCDMKQQGNGTMNWIPTKAHPAGGQCPRDAIEVQAIHMGVGNSGQDRRGSIQDGLEALKGSMNFQGCLCEQCVRDALEMDVIDIALGISEQARPHGTKKVFEQLKGSPVYAATVCDEQGKICRDKQRKIHPWVAKVVCKTLGMKAKRRVKLADTDDSLIGSYTELERDPLCEIPY